MSEALPPHLMATLGVLGCGPMPINGIVPSRIRPLYAAGLIRRCNRRVGKTWCICYEITEAGTTALAESHAAAAMRRSKRLKEAA